MDVEAIHTKDVAKELLGGGASKPDDVPAGASAAAAAKTPFTKKATDEPAGASAAAAAKTPFTKKATNGSNPAPPAVTTEGKKRPTNEKTAGAPPVEAEPVTTTKGGKRSAHAHTLPDISKEIAATKAAKEPPKKPKEKTPYMRFEAADAGFRNPHESPPRTAHRARCRGPASKSACWRCQGRWTGHWKNNPEFS